MQDLPKADYFTFVLQHYFFLKNRNMESFWTYVTVMEWLSQN